MSARRESIAFSATAFGDFVLVAGGEPVGEARVEVSASVDADGCVEDLQAIVADSEVIEHGRALALGARAHARLADECAWRALSLTRGDRPWPAHMRGEVKL